TADGSPASRASSEATGGAPERSTRGKEGTEKVTRACRVATWRKGSQEGKRCSLSARDLRETIAGGSSLFLGRLLEPFTRPKDSGHPTSASSLLRNSEGCGAYIGVRTPWFVTGQIYG